MDRSCWDEVTVLLSATNETHARFQGLQQTQSSEDPEQTEQTQRQREPHVVHWVEINREYTSREAAAKVYTDAVCQKVLLPLVVI